MIWTRSNNYYFTGNPRSRQLRHWQEKPTPPPPDEPGHSTQPKDTRSLDENSSLRLIDRLQDKTKSPQRRAKKPKSDVWRLSATLKLIKHICMLYISLHFCDYENHALFDTGATQGAKSEGKLRRILTAHPLALLYEMPASEHKVLITNRSKIFCRKTSNFPISPRQKNVL